MLSSTSFAAVFGVVVLCCVSLSGCASSHSGRGGVASPSPGIEFATVEAEGRSYPYAVFVPRGFDASRRWPLVVFLHGSGESGTNGTRQLVVGLPKHMMWDSAAWPCVVLMPQKPDQDSQWEDHIAALRAMLDRARKDFAIDDQRIVLTGLSQGGHGCLSVNAAMPGRFAALAPVCGYANLPIGGDREGWQFVADDPLTRRMLDAARGMPVWFFHGEADTVVPVAHSIGMHEALHAGGSDVRLTTYPGVGHDSWDKAYSDPALREWLLNARLHSAERGR